jgi:hypothetical protein
MINKSIINTNSSIEDYDNQKNNRNTHNKPQETIPVSIREFLYDLHLEQIEQM